MPCSWGKQGRHYPTRPLAARRSVPTATTVMPTTVMPTTAVTATVVATEKSVKNTHESFSFRKHVKATWGSGWLHHYFSKRVDMIRIQE
ncbi:hypothetical protein A9F06_27525 [Klebsiella pneumoniae]|nr:hypothetical protein A9F06_27525 [Klebsiella pneumoniae]